MKENIGIVNFVRNKDVAQIHLLVTLERTGNGVEWTLNFLGKENFQGLNNTITYFSAGTDTYQEEREEFVRHFEIGLIPFISQTSLINYIGVYFENIETESTPIKIDDPWNSWVFEIEARTGFSGEQKQKFFDINGSVEASRVTEKWKVEIGGRGGYESSYYELDEDTLSYYQYNTRFSGLAVNSLSSHWSLGGKAFVSSSTFNNIAIRAGASPAIEYNIFPYSEYSRHEFSFLYTIAPTYYQYGDTTIYNKTDQFLIEQNLKVNYELVETWGSVEATVSGSAFLYDLSKNRLDIRAEFDVRIFRGLSVFFFGNYSLINNQIALPKGGATSQEELLRLQDLFTGYEYRMGFGISFTFGSIYNNIVNPRFD